MDAPPGTLLAYATSPGNVASDGGGVHGATFETRLKRWMAPDTVRRPIVTENYRKIRGTKRRGGMMERVLGSERVELVAYKQP